jgi:predicted transcriptional regulator
LSLNRYMSEILKYNRVTLGSAERRFMNEMMGKKKSVYSMWSILKRSGHTMAYKNVHTRIKRLEKLNLIEKAGKAKYGAINYQLTTQGILYQVSQFVNIDESLSWSDFLPYYSNNIIFETLVLPYFEEDTIKHAGVMLYFAIVLYLGDCYQITLDAADRIRKAIVEHNEEDKEYFTKRLIEDLEWQPREFALKLVTSFFRKKGGGVILGQLAKDKKFVHLLREVQKDFDKGFSAINKIHSKL